MLGATPPEEHLARIAALFPRFWRAIEGMRAARDRDLSDWPPWCYCPPMLVGAGETVSTVHPVGHDGH